MLKVFNSERRNESHRCFWLAKDNCDCPRHHYIWVRCSVLVNIQHIHIKLHLDVNKMSLLHLYVVLACSVIGDSQHQTDAPIYLQYQTDAPINVKDLDLDIESTTARTRDVGITKSLEGLEVYISFFINDFFLRFILPWILNQLDTRLRICTCGTTKPFKSLKYCFTRERYNK